MRNRFLLIHDPRKDEILIPIKDICKIELSSSECTIDIYTYGGAHYWEDCFSSDGTERLTRFIEINLIVNGEYRPQAVCDYITTEEENIEKE